MQVTFSLARQARKSGGDRYEARVSGKDWTVYFPQSISRKNSDTPQETITIEIK